MRVLLVDPDADARAVYGLALAHAGFDVHACVGLDEALEFVGRLRPRLVVLGEIEPDGHALSVGERLRRLGDCDYVLCVRAWEGCDGCGCDAYFLKPFSPLDLVREVTVRIGIPGPASPVDVAARRLAAGLSGPAPGGRDAGAGGG